METRTRRRTADLPTRRQRHWLVAKMNALLFERPIWFATGPVMFEEEAQDREEFIYHRPVLVREAIELLAPRAGALVLDATCGGGGQSAAVLETGRRGLAVGQGSGF